MAPIHMTAIIAPTAGKEERVSPLPYDPTNKPGTDSL